MGDKETSSAVVMAVAAAPAVTTKKTSLANVKKPRVKPTHPKTAEMVNTAVKTLMERRGSSLQAIKKFMAITYKIDTEKQAPFIKRYLKAAVESGVLIHTKGKGATGSFKLSSAKVNTVRPKVKSSTMAATLTKSYAKKTTAAKKPVAKKSYTKKTVATGKIEKKTVSKGPVSRVPKPKTIKSKSTMKKIKSVTAKMTKKVAAKPKNVALNRATVSKK